MKWKSILESGNPPLEYSKWMEEDKLKLQEMAKLEVDYWNTAFGCAPSQTKRKLLNSIDTISEEERVELRHRMAKEFYI